MSSQFTLCRFVVVSAAPAPPLLLLPLVTAVYGIAKPPSLGSRRRIYGPCVGRVVKWDLERLATYATQGQTPPACTIYHCLHLELPK